MNKTNNDPLKSVKEIEGFLSGKVRPFMTDIHESKKQITASLEKIKSLKDAKEANGTEEVQPNVETVAPVVEAEKKPEAAPVVEEVKETKEVEKESLKETKPVVEEKPAAEVKNQEKPSNHEDKKEYKSEQKTSKEPHTRTFINKNEMPNYRNNKPNQGNIDVSIYQNKDRNRNNKDRRNNQEQREQREPRDKKPGFNKDFNNNKPNKFEQTPQIDVSIKTDNRDRNRKKNNNGYQKGGDDTHKNMSKRDLAKKGYTVDKSLYGDSDTIRYVKQKKVKKGTDQDPQFIKIEHAVLNSDVVPIKLFGEKIGKTATEIVKKLFELDIMANINGSITFEQAELVAIDYGITLELKVDKTAEDKLKDIVQVNKDDNAKLVKRPPVVTIMGHVDHGKTSLLDYIRKTNVVEKEAGGITQHIGAYTIDLNNEKITFLDTPGHEAFTDMRRRGANVTDIAIIVIAADDGIMPQTVEAINHAKQAGVEIVIAINKVDKVKNYDKVLQQLTNYDLLPSEWGGQTICCPISAKFGQGVQDLLEQVLLVAECMELKANKKCKASGTIIEARLDKGLGPVATVLVQNGTLKVKDYVVAGTTIGRIRAMKDYTGKTVKEAGPSYAVQVQGFSEVPNAGDLMVVVADDKLAKQVVQERIDKERNEMQMRSNARTLDDMFKNVTSEDVKVLPMIIKADVQGSAEAIKQSMEQLSDNMKEENVKIRIVHYGVGAVNESDVMLADTANAIIIGFNVKPDAKAKALADRSKVDIRNYSIIYDAIDDVTRALKGMQAPKYNEVIIGHAEVRAVFKISNYGMIAGSYITDGKVSRNSGARIFRDKTLVFEGKLSSLKREKNDAKEVAAGYECGIGFDNFNDVKVGDTIESYILERIDNE